jgi:membrane protein implicated in regulation of membrane protease activity
MISAIIAAIITILMLWYIPVPTLFVIGMGIGTFAVTAFGTAYPVAFLVTVAVVITIGVTAFVWIKARECKDRRRIPSPPTR